LPGKFFSNRRTLT